MRLMLCGDVVGRAGRDAVVARLPSLRHELALDFVVVNGENAAHGFGITDKICAELYASGVDVITTGNHVWDRREIMAYIAGDPRLLRPINYPAAQPGRGFGIYRLADGLLGEHRLGDLAAILLDFHGEATSEKNSMGHFCDGRASAVIGTHSHVPTADYRILPKGTAYMTDIGMCGDYDSVIGMRKEGAIARFVTKLPGERLEVAEGEATLCAVVIETDDTTGLATAVAPLRLGGKLAPAWPDFARAPAPAK
jgi:hypothetical protein